MQRPFELYPAWYSACGVHYECPQRYGAHPEISASEARHLSNIEIRKAFRNRVHYLWLDVDSTPDSFDAFNEQIANANVISLYRVEAPTPESKLAVFIGGRPLASATV